MMRSTRLLIWLMSEEGYCPNLTSQLLSISMHSAWAQSQEWWWKRLSMSLVLNQVYQPATWLTSGQTNQKTINNSTIYSPSRKRRTKTYRHSSNSFQIQSPLQHLSKHPNRISTSTLVLPSSRKLYHRVCLLPFNLISTSESQLKISNRALSLRSWFHSKIRQLSHNLSQPHLSPRRITSHNRRSWRPKLLLLGHWRSRLMILSLRL